MSAGQDDDGAFCRTNCPGGLKAWLPFLNTYRTMCVAPAPEFQRLLDQVSHLDRAALAA